MAENPTWIEDTTLPRIPATKYYEDNQGESDKSVEEKAYAVTNTSFKLFKKILKIRIIN